MRASGQVKAYLCTAGCDRPGSRFRKPVRTARESVCGVDLVDAAERLSIRNRDPSRSQAAQSSTPNKIVRGGMCSGEQHVEMIDFAIAARRQLCLEYASYEHAHSALCAA